MASNHRASEIDLRSPGSVGISGGAGHPFYQKKCQHGLVLALVTLLAYGLRAQRLEWQPLWWDEGYSVFFATEPLARMVALTARDIHPPLYYAALHGWTDLLGHTGPAALRLFSIAAGTIAVPLIGVLAGILARRSFVAAVSAAALLAVNPLHIYYSQEIRMYSLATALGLASSVCIVAWTLAHRQERDASGWFLAFAVLTLLLVHTLYYAAILVAAQFVWSAWMVRRRKRAMTTLVAGGFAVLLAAVPWWRYAGPKLLEYVANKLQSDQDSPLALGDYLVRHLTAFAAGHVGPVNVSTVVLLAVIALAFVPFLLTTRNRLRVPGVSPLPLSYIDSVSFLLLTSGGVLAIGFLINLRFPFFPEGGERLLLFALPYFLALIALGMAFSSLQPLARAALVAPFVFVSLTGIAGFYSQPRHAQLDYRGIVAEVDRRGSQEDTVLALFPWQVGYWRAYGQRDEHGNLLAPQPEPVGQEILVWDEALRTAIDVALARGTLWFPEPLSLGSTLPLQIEEYLNQHALSVENEWQTESTRLTAWVGPSPISDLTPLSVDFGPATLAAYSISPASIPSDNSILDTTLAWTTPLPDGGARVAVKLVDRSGNAWAERDYEPPGRFSDGENASSGQHVDRFGMQVPAGMPTGVYTVALSMLDESGRALTVNPNGSGLTQSVPLASVNITAPEHPPPPVRVPVDHLIEVGQATPGIAILGTNGMDEQPAVLAGSDLALQLVLQNRSASPADHEIYVALEDDRGQTAAQWQGWPIPSFPASQWEEGQIVRVPVELHVPASMSPGPYRLVAAVVNDFARSEYAPVELARVAVSSRHGRFDPVTSAIPLPTPVQYGTHARLIGYETSARPGAVEVTLDWEVMRPLLPQHHIFVHALGADGAVIAQQDGPPHTEAGPAPTGSWRPGEYLSTRHIVALPRTANTGSGAQALSVGLYDPKTGIRLPATIDGTPSGDSARLPVAP